MTHADARPRANFVVVANRLPVHPVSSESGVTWVRSPGGLAAALASVLRERDGVWIGWSGSVGPVEPPEAVEGVRLHSVPMEPREYEDFYLGFSNATLWPLYHDAVRSPAFHREWWRSYRRVNERFATAAATVASVGATVWIHDYQLQLVPLMLRARRPDLRIGFFLHIPFPPRELFLQLPWRREIIDGLLGADLVGFQVPSAASNFSRLARLLTGASGTNATLDHDGRTVRIGAYPISIDSADLEARARSATVKARCGELRRDLGSPKRVLLGVDRLDYTKGIDHRIRAISELFAEGVLTTGNDVVIQIAVPTREEESHYQAERRQLEQVVSEANGEHALVGQPAVHYLHHSLPLDELVAMYLAADVMLVTPFRDGMNLVAKEYVACRADLSGALVLSEFAGAAAELKGAFLVNPHDLEGMKEGIRHAIGASTAERRARMLRMRRSIQRNDVHEWARSYLEALTRPAVRRSDSKPRPARTGEVLDDEALLAAEFRSLR